MSRSIFVRQLVAATREELWAACSTARGMSKWQADVAFGDASSANNITLSWPALKLSIDLEVKEVVPFERLVLGIGTSRLTLEIEPGEVRLTHAGLRTDDEEDGMRSAWRTSLGLLSHALTKHPHRERRVHWVTRAAKTCPELCHVFFTDPAALRQWLTRVGAIGEQGSSLSAQLMNGDAVTGEVFANTPNRDVAFTWQEQQESYLVLRTFPSPNAVGERLIALSWSRFYPEPFPPSVTRFMDAAVGRLAHLLERYGQA
ncbi:MAG TPA: SRPBCC domain-containing protein [Polyangiaceae bacterium]